jgi:eukaryotic-like serine/threonine-protein kinase
VNLPPTLRHYRILSLLGEGDVAQVYHAVNTLNGQEVALKVLRADSPVDDARSYFENERVILAQLSHPNIPAFYEYVEGEPPALAMGIVEGKDGETLLAELADGEFLDAERVVKWGVQIAGALAYLHDHTPPIAFRDLKPSHIMVDGQDRAWLVDFNLAKILPESKRLTDADLMGTEGFSAPEQYKGVVTPWTDIYTLGATLHYMLTGINPRHERLFTYAPLRSANPAIPRSVAEVVMRALAYDPEDRFQSMEEMQAALMTALSRM